ncbi:3941_t:CDS:1 [Funneliformis caledonium]|uniref:3941_t:CDS:1 n=1 Tax=Funneliformis caledonium TaxID=1117310 RepID=A0A9N8YY82_9GLOM|nr:3941_t:CDS:1 [Funneliformis caledonium]
MTTINPSPQLTPDCLEDVFDYLRNDRSSLFSCLLVNRLWCRLVIHLIWSDPFAIDSSDTSLSNIIQTYISCLPDTSRQLIVNKIRNTEEKTDETSNDDDSTQLNFQQPLFIYPEYLQNLDLKNFNDALRVWHKEHDKSFDESIPDFTISKVLVDFIFEKCSSISQLNVHLWDKWNIPLFEMNFDLLFNRKNERNVFFNLKDFKFTFLAKERSEGLPKSHQIIVNLFKMMERTSNNIQSMEIIFRLHHPPEHVDQVIENLIKAQKNLKTYKSNEFWDSKKPNIYNVLMKKNNSLTYLNLINLSYFHESLIEGLMACKNLETLELSRCPEMPSRYLDSSPKSNLSIKNLKFYYSTSFPVCEETFITLLQMCNINLRKLVVKGVTGDIIDAICLNNSQITHLSLCAHQQIFDPPQSLSSLTNLTHLKLGSYQAIIFVDRTLPYFIDSLPSSLRHLYFNFNMSPISLIFFLNECKIPLKSIEFHQVDVKDDDVIDAMINYKKSNHESCEEIRLFIKQHFYLRLEETRKYVNIIMDASNAHQQNYDLW